MQIQEINHDESLKVIETRKPLGLFYSKDGNIFIGIDNSRGDAWTEEFETLDDCLTWLNRG